MDGHDWKELSAAKIARQRQKKHFERYGSILYCPERDTICAFMEKNVKDNVKCTRVPCIKDDPEDQELQKRIEKNRRQALKEESKRIQEEKDAAPIRDQRNFIQSHIDKEMKEIHRLEEASQEAFRRNKPGLGHTLFNRANIKRHELKEWQDKNERKESVVNDQQSNSENHR